MIATRTWNRGQAEAIERRGRVFVSAGAGTGKTSVLIERVVRRLQEGTPLDHLLVITFTERAADELKRRIRVRLRELEMLDAEAAVESAWISTIHGLCARVLRAHALEAGIEYRHFKALGTPKEGRDAARRHDHAALERIYAGQLELPEAMAAGAELADLAGERRVALLCYERSAPECHRTLLRQAMLPGFEAVDLLPKDPV